MCRLLQSYKFPPFFNRRRIGENMNIFNTFALLAQISDSNNPTIFPFPFSLHLGLAIISLVFFGFRFVSQKKPFQIIFAIAVPLSLLIWLSESKTLFYGLGLVELILILLAIVMSIASRPKDTAENAGSKKSGRD